MNRRSALRSLFAAGAGSLFAHSPEADDRQNFTLRSDVRLVLLDVSVKDSKGAAVSGLSKADFRVFENHRPQQITVFDHDDVPVTVGILVDQSRSMGPKRDEVITAAQIFIEESNRRDEMFVLHFNDRVLAGLPAGTSFSDNVQLLRTALDRGVPEGKTALNDAVMEGLRHLALGTRGKRALVLISDGGDNASRHSRREMLDAVERSIATIYTIGLFDQDDPDRDPGILRQLARISGGETYLPKNLTEVAPVCRRIAREIRTRYTIGYPAPPGDADLRHIRVMVSAAGRGNLVVRARSEYRYGEIEEQSRN